MKKISQIWLGLWCLVDTIYLNKITFCWTRLLLYTTLISYLNSKVKKKHCFIPFKKHFVTFHPTVKFEQYYVTNTIFKYQISKWKTLKRIVSTDLRAMNGEYKSVISHGYQQWNRYRLLDQLVLNSYLNNTVASEQILKYMQGFRLPSVIGRK